MKPYQDFAVTVERAEKQSPRLLPTHTIGCNHTHMAGPNIFHPAAKNTTAWSTHVEEGGGGTHIS